MKPRLPPQATRVACTCIRYAVSQRHWETPLCPACFAWDRCQEVLLTDGTTLPRTVWVLAHEPGEEAQ